MVNNYFESILESALKNFTDNGEITINHGADAVYDKIYEKFPFSGSKINWKSVDNAIQDLDENEPSQTKSFETFFAAITEKYNLSGKVMYVGDSATDFCIIGTIDSFLSALPSFFSIPQHHYFVDINFSWCMCFTMEGDMGFGFSTK